MKARILFLVLTVAFAAATEVNINFHFADILAGVDDSCSGSEGETFDYIVVGAGIGGSVVAGRLAQAGNTVLLLEAGPELDDVSKFETTIPFSGWVWTNDYLTDDIKSKESPNAFNRRFTLQNGRGTGGTANVFAGAYSRPYVSELLALGVDGWTTDAEVLDSLKKWERYPTADPLHGQTGPMGIELPESREPYIVTQKVIDAINATLGSAIFGNPDPLSGYNSLGAYRKARYGFANLPNGGLIKTTPFNAYVAPLLQAGDPNIVVRSDSTVSSLLFEDSSDTLKVTGVSYLHFVDGKSQEKKVNARKEVILSAGAYKTPPILLRSGVGPASNIVESKLVLDGVGKNLFVRPLSVVIYLGDQVDPKANYYDPDFKKDTFEQFIFNNTGPLTNAMVDLDVALKSVTSDPASPYPDFFMELVSSIPDVVSPPTAYGFACLQNKPKSRGEIKLKSSNPYNNPDIFPNMFGDITDAITLAECCLTARLVLSATGDPELSPGPTVTTPEEMIGIILMTSNQAYHAGGTSKMGPSSDPLAVVDSSFKVYGLKNVRVVDASILPENTSGNSGSAVLTLAEKAAELILSS